MFSGGLIQTAVETCGRFGGWVDLENGVRHFLGKAEAETKKRKGVVRMPATQHQKMQTWHQDGSHVISFRGPPVSNIDKAFGAAVRRAGSEDVTPHTLKHTVVTWAFMTLEDAPAFFDRSYSPDALGNAAGIMDLKLQSVVREAESRKERTYPAQTSCEPLRISLRPAA